MGSNMANLSHLSAGALPSQVSLWNVPLWQSAENKLLLFRHCRWRAPSLCGRLQAPGLGQRGLSLKNTLEKALALKKMVKKFEMPSSDAKTNDNKNSWNAASSSCCYFFVYFRIASVKRASNCPADILKYDCSRPCHTFATLL